MKLKQDRPRTGVGNRMGGRREAVFRSTDVAVVGASEFGSWIEECGARRKSPVCVDVDETGVLLGHVHHLSLGYIVSRRFGPRY